MTHTPDCQRLLDQCAAAQAAYKSRWPNYCTHCDGSGCFVFSQSVPYGSTTASFPVTEPCELCSGLGLCPRCGQPGLTSEERGDSSTGDGPCRVCGWKDGADGLPPGPECVCPYEDEPDYQSSDWEG